MMKLKQLVRRITDRRTGCFEFDDDTERLPDRMTRQFKINEELRNAGTQSDVSKTGEIK